MHHYRAPRDGATVCPAALESALSAIFHAVGVPTSDASIISRLMVDTDLRGVSSHGVQQATRYVNSFAEGTTNTRPNCRVLSNAAATAATAAMTGDGGLGIVVGAKAMELAIAKARQHGVGCVTTTHHAHIGSAGKYVRMAQAHDMLGICFSGRSTSRSPGAYSKNDTPISAIQGSPPISFGAPSDDDNADFLADFASHMVMDNDIFSKMPEVYFRALGMSTAANIFSGSLGGQMIEQATTGNNYPAGFSAADQSAFFLAINISSFVDTGAFKADVGLLMRSVARMKPLPGFDEAAMPGGTEHAKQEQYTRDGQVPLSKEAVVGLKQLTKRYGVALPELHGFDDEGDKAKL